MPTHIKRIKTTGGESQIDYSALANLPTSDTSLSVEGGFADAMTTGSELDYLENTKSNIITNKIEGKNLYLTDSTNIRMQEMRVMGKTTKSGNNLISVTPYINSFGANLLPYPYQNNSLTSYGVTFTVHGDGSISLRGTSNGEAKFIIYNGSAINSAKLLSGCNSSGDYSLVAANGSSKVECRVGHVDVPSGVTQVYISVKNGVTVNGTVKPMLSAEVSDYELYKSNSWNYNKKELLGVPVESNGTYVDETGQHWICDEVRCSDSKHIQRIGVIDSYTGKSINTPYISSTGGLDTGAKVYYVLDDFVTTNVDTKALNTYYPITTIDSNAHLIIDYGLDVKNHIKQNYVSIESYGYLEARVAMLESHFQ